LSPFPASLAVLLSVLAFVLLGVRLRAVLPVEHLSSDSKDVIKLGTGLIATLVALILGLLVATAKSSFDAKRTEVKQIAAQIVQMDRTLRQFGPEAVGVRRMLRGLLAERAERPWIEGTNASRDDDVARANRVDGFVEAMLALQPTNERQQRLKSRALQLSTEAVNLRWLFAQELESSLPRPLLVVLVFWLGVIFASLGLFAPRNGTVFAFIVLCALSVSTAVFVVLELDQPFSGLVELSREPFRVALRQLDQ
jgi:hypothetical protein